MDISNILRLSRVIPVVTIDDTRYALPLAKALVDGGINVIEVTLRTPTALEAVKLICETYPDTIVGVGTVTETIQIPQAKAAGAKFVVSPGFTQALAGEAIKAGLPFLPGACTPSEIMAAREVGFHYLKFFPAEQAGGVPMLRSFAPMFPDIKFFPTGGINRQNMNAYLALPNVIAVGGSWLVNPALIKSKDWQTIASLARQTTDQEMAG